MANLDPTTAPPTPREREQLDLRITRVRGELDEIVAELEGRVRRTTDVGQQAREHRGAIALAAAGVLLAVVGYGAIVISTFRQIRKLRRL